MARSSASVSVVLVAVLGLTACTQAPEPPRPTSTAPVVQLGAPGESNRTLAPDEQLEVPLVEHTEADVAFVRDMLHHHAQAIEMVGFVEDRTDDADIRLLTERMRISQEDEIELFETWLRDRGEPVRDTGHSHRADMPGMLTDAEMAALEAASGAAFDRLFLESMIRHHDGALVMVAELYAAEGGQEPDLGALARHIDSDQRIEIARMAQLLAERS